MNKNAVTSYSFPAKVLIRIEVSYKVDWLCSSLFVTNTVVLTTPSATLTFSSRRPICDPLNAGQTVLRSPPSAQNPRIS